MIKLKETNHPYYCDKHGSYNFENYDSWSDFKDDWNINNIDHDLNFVIRFDIEPMLDEEAEEIEGKWTLNIYYLQQRKGRYVPVEINNIRDSDMAEINSYLKSCSEYMNEMWKEYK